MPDPTTYNIKIKQGAKWTRTLTWTNPDGSPVDISTYTFRAQIRKKANAAPIVVDLNTPDEITIVDGPNGIWKIFIGATITSAFTVKGNYEWDCFVCYNGNPDDVDCLWEGEVEIVENITEPSH